MFSTCGSLAELNAMRQRLIKDGVSVKDVNSAYNKAKKTIMDAVPTFRKIPTFTGETITPRTFVALPIISMGGKLNEIHITEEGARL